MTIIFLTSLIVLVSITWANAIDRASLRARSSLVPVEPGLCVMKVHVATKYRRARGQR